MDPLCTISVLSLFQAKVHFSYSDVGLEQNLSSILVTLTS